MSVLEIRTTGELFLGGNLIGQVTFTAPFAENDAAGEWWADDPHGDGWGGPHECAGCDERDSDIDYLEDEVDGLEDKVAALTKERDELIRHIEAEIGGA